VLVPPEVGGVDVGGVDVSSPADPICRIPGMFSARGTFSDSAPSWSPMPGASVDVEADGVADGLDEEGAAVAAMAGIRSSDVAVPTTATHCRTVRTSVRMTRRMSPLRSNRFSRRLHNPTSAQVSYL